MSQGQTIGIREAFKIAQGKGYRQDQPLSYMTLASIIAEAYKRGYDAAERKKAKPQ